MFEEEDKGVSNCTLMRYIHMLDG